MPQQPSVLRVLAACLLVVALLIGAPPAGASDGSAPDREGRPVTATVGGPPDAADPLPLDQPPETLPVMRDVLPQMAEAPTPGELTAPSAVLMDALTGEVVFAKDAETPRAPASITKIMTVLLTYEAVAAGEAAWDDSVTITELAQGMGGTQAFLSAGQTFSLADLLKAVVVASANDAAVAIAEHLAGSSESFVERMNRRAKELGMNDTHFANPHGLDDPEHYMSALDVAIVSRELLLRFPEVLELTGIWTYTFEVAENCCLLTNTNKMIRRYQGVDGLKTGWTSQAGYSVSATGARGDTRFIAVVMGHENSTTRFEEAARLLSWGFANWTSVPIVRSGDLIRDLPVYEGSERGLALVAATDFAVLVRRGEADRIVQEMNVPEFAVAPVAEREVLGVLRVRQGERVLGQVDLVADRPVKRLALHSLWWRLWIELQQRLSAGARTR